MSLPLASVAAAVLVASCSTVSGAKPTFKVNDTKYPADAFASLIDDLASGGQLQLTNGKMNMADYVPIMRTLVRYEAYKQMAAELGITESDSTRSQAESAAAQTQGWAEFPESVKQLVIDLGVADATLATLQAPSNADLAALYAASPASTGVLCMSHILVATESDARKVVARLAAGEKFADLAREVSTEPAAKETGGSLGTGPDQPCQGLSGVQNGYDPDFVDGAVAARAGVPTPPVKSSFGWHVILLHPFDEVSANLREVLAQDVGNTLLAGWMATADISVDPRYGTWSVARSTIE